MSPPEQALTANRPPHNRGRPAFFVAGSVFGLLVVSGLDTGCSSIGNTGPIRIPVGWPTNQSPLGNLTPASHPDPAAANGPTGTAWPLIPAPRIETATEAKLLSSADLPQPPSRYVTAVAGKSNEFDVEVAVNHPVSQHTDTLCWAACTQMLLAQSGVVRDQDQLGIKFRPDQEDKAADFATLMRALCPELEPQLAQQNIVPLQLIGTHSDEMLAELSSGRLCIVGLVEDEDDAGGHACVVCGAKFSKVDRRVADVIGTLFTVNNAQVSNVVARYALTEVELFDPEPGVGVRSLSADEFKKQVRFITSRRMANNVLREALTNTSARLPGGGKKTPLKPNTGRNAPSGSAGTINQGKPNASNGAGNKPH